jgi:hypothetical protein
MLQHYCTLWPPLSNLIYVIKKWAKCRGLNDPSRRNGPSFSSYCLTLMIVGFLQASDICVELCVYAHTRLVSRRAAQSSRPAICSTQESHSFFYHRRTQYMQIMGMGRRYKDYTCEMLGRLVPPACARVGTRRRSSTRTSLLRVVVVSD